MPNDGFITVITGAVSHVTKLVGRVVQSFCAKGLLKTKVLLNN